MHANSKCWIICLAIAFQGIHGQLTVKPSNKVANVGDQVIFNCTVTGTAATWPYCPLTRPCCNAFNGFVVDHTCVNITRYTVERPGSNQYNLVINNTQMGDAGTYICREATGTLEGTAAAYGVIGSRVEATSNVTGTSVTEGEEVIMKCNTTYTGTALMPMIMTWTPLDGQPELANSSGIFTSKLSIPVDKRNIDSHTCKVNFSAPTANTFSPDAYPGVEQAMNMPSYVSTSSSTPAYTTHYCPFNVNISSSPPPLSYSPNVACVPPNTTFHCTAASYPDPLLYLWMHGDVNIGNGSEFALNQEYSVIVNLTCKVTNNVTSGNGVSRLCSNNTSISINVSNDCKTTTTAAITTGQPTTSTSNTEVPTGSLRTSSIIPSTGSSEVTMSPTVAGSKSAFSTTTVPPPCAACYCKAECIAPAVVCSVVGGVAIIIVIVIVMKKTKKGATNKYHENQSDDGSDQMPSQSNTNPAFDKSSSYPMSSPPDVIQPHPGGSHHYQQNNKEFDDGCQYAELDNKPRSRAPVAISSDTVYAPIDKA